MSVIYTVLFCKTIFSNTHILIFDWRPQYSTWRTVLRPTSVVSLLTICQLGLLNNQQAIEISMKKIMIQKLLRTIGISEQSTLLCEKKNCYPVVRFSGTPYRLVLSQKSTGYTDGRTDILLNAAHKSTLREQKPSHLRLILQS